MIVFVNDKAEIHDVGTTNDPTLTGLFIKDEGNPFADWSKDKICCYKVTVVDGVVTMFTPYITSSVIPAIERLGHEIEAVTPWMETQSVSMGAKAIEFTDVPEGPVTVIIKDSEGRYHPGSIVINGSIVIVSFEPLEYAADITLKVG